MELRADEKDILKILIINELNYYNEEDDVDKEYVEKLNKLLEKVSE